MDLEHALDEALTAHYRPRAIASASSTTRGRNARVRALETAAGSPAAAARLVGVTPRTWNAWKSGTRPTQRSLERLERAYTASERSRRTQRATTLAPTVHAVIQFGDGDSDSRPRARTVHFDQMDLHRVVTAWSTGDLEHAAELFLADLEDNTPPYVPITLDGDVHIRF